jgi:hypothetical protein
MTAQHQGTRLLQHEASASCVMTTRQVAWRPSSREWVLVQHAQKAAAQDTAISHVQQRKRTPRDETASKPQWQ